MTGHLLLPQELVAINIRHKEEELTAFLQVCERCNEQELTASLHVR